MFFSVRVLYGEEGKAKSAYAFSIIPAAGIFWGKAKEILYKYPDAGTPVSQLLWDFKPLVYAGTDLEFGPRDPFAKSGVSAGGSLKFGFPFVSGVMEDRDWAADDGDYLTNYSRHDALSNGAFMVDLSAGFSWAILSTVTVRVYGELSYHRFSWTSEGGYIQYPKDSSGNYLYDQPWTPDLPTDPVYGTGITYTQNWLMFSPGFSLGLKLSRRFSAGCFIAWTPFIYAVCIDDHLLALSKGERYTRGEDYLKGGISTKAGLKISFAPKEGLEFSLSAGFRNVSGPRGDSYNMNMGVDTGGSFSLSTYEGGAGLLVLDTALSAKIQL
ncbi:MAG: omptin family outer membrane protease [Treponema sp.]|nr:omptin family outer membrane protease [Treponema sp.]